MWCTIEDCVECYVLGLRPHRDWFETILAGAAKLGKEMWEGDVEND